MINNKLYYKTWKKYFCILILILNTGCVGFTDVANVWAQPDKKDLCLFNKGTTRNKLISSFGPPLKSEIIGNKRFETFKFIKGRNISEKILAGAIGIPMALAGGYMVADPNVLLKTPEQRHYELEQEHITVQVSYDESNKIDNNLYTQDCSIK